MTHPEELLAGYVDGTLSVKDRAAVDTHVADLRLVRDSAERDHRPVLELEWRNLS